MKLFILAIVVLVAVSTPSIAQSSAAKRQASGCKSGNLLQESDQTLIEEIQRTLAELRTAVAKGDKRGVARLVHYPLHFATADTEFTINSQQEFLTKYDQILPPPLRDLIRRLETRCISRVGNKGFTIGTGQVWFDRFPDGKVKIFAVNAVVYPGE
jgi:hypothetical protein